MSAPPGLSIKNPNLSPSFIRTQSQPSSEISLKIDQLIIHLIQLIGQAQNTLTYIPTWADLSDLFLSINIDFSENDFDNKRYNVDIDKVAVLLVKLVEFSNMIPSSVSALSSVDDSEVLITEQLRGLSLINKIIYNFVDMKNQTLPLEKADILVSWYLKNLKNFHQFLDNENFQKNYELQEKISECIGALATVIYENGPILSTENIKKLVSSDEDGVLKPFLMYFPLKKEPRVEMISSSNSIFGVEPDANQSSLNQDTNTNAEDDLEQFRKALSPIPKSAILVLYNICEKSSNQNAQPEKFAWLRRIALARINESFRLYHLNFGKFKKIREMSINHASYLLSVSRGLEKSVSNIGQEDETLQEYQVKQLLEIISYQITVGLIKAPKNDTKMETEMAQPIPDSIATMTGNRKFKGKLPYSRSKGFRKANKKKQHSKGGYSSASDSEPTQSQNLSRDSNIGSDSILDPELPKPNFNTKYLARLDANRHFSSSELSASDVTDSESIAPSTNRTTHPGSVHGCHRSSAERRRTGKLLTHCREGSLKALYYILKILPQKTVLGFYESFLALENNISDDPGDKVNLFTTLWLDPARNNRILACQILSIYFVNSNKFLMTIANENEKNFKNLTTMGLNLAKKIRFSVLALVELIKKENCLDVKINLIACLQKLVQNVPFQKLKDGLISIILNESCRPFILEILNINQTSKSSNSSEVHAKFLKQAVQLTASILKITPNHHELINLSISPEACTKSSWIYQAAVRLVSEEFSYYFDSVLGAEKIILIDAITKAQPKLLFGHEREFFDLASQKILKKLPNEYVSLENSTSKRPISQSTLNFVNSLLSEKILYLQFLEKAMNTINEKCMDNISYREERQVLWDNLFENRTIHTGFEQIETVSATANLIALIDRDSFEKIIHKEHVYIASIILGNIDRYVMSSGATGPAFLDLGLDSLSIGQPGNSASTSITTKADLKLRDAKDELIASSIRAAGKLSTFPSFQSDFQFLSDLADAIISAYPIEKNPNNVNFKIRNNTALATANLATCFSKNIEKLGQEMREFFDPNRIFANLIKLSCKATKDKAEKVVPHGLRALGELTFIFWELYPKRAANPTYEDNMFKNVYKLLFDNLAKIGRNDTSSAFEKLTRSKIRWNSACAMKAIMDSENFRNSEKGDILYIELFFEGCITAFINSHIHKVKNCCADMIFRITSWSSERIYILGRFILLSYYRDVMHVNSTYNSNRPEKQIGVKRIILKLFLFFLQILDVDENNCQEVSLKEAEHLKFKCVENSKFKSEYLKMHGKDNDFLKLITKQEKIINTKETTNLEDKFNNRSNPKERNWRNFQQEELVPSKKITFFKHYTFDVEDELGVILGDIFESVKGGCRRVSSKNFVDPRFVCQKMRSW